MADEATTKLERRAAWLVATVAVLVLMLVIAGYALS
ncbi:MAG: V-type ATPase subunit a family protein [Xanthobacteraceae bacterium]|nr:V-type ATPase subunit a family protein [Xanthobacteraceae bacterium]